MTLKRIFSILRHPTTIKVAMVLVLVGFFFILPTFAQNAQTTSTSLESTKKLLNEILRLCSRGRVILAILAGKLMTNDRVYGSILHMDIYLRKIRNIMKNFANFALIGLVLYNIIKNLVGKGGMDIKKIIINTLIAGILIQASRFLVGALVDLSTVATAAVGSFPSSFLKSDINLQQKLKNTLSATPKRYLISINTGDAIEPIDAAGTIEGDAMREDILPTYNSVSGPLIYLGFSVFKFQNYMSANSGSAEELSISFLLRVILIIFYTLGLALLFIANIIRVAFLRIFVIGAPLIILSMIFFGKDKALGGSSSSGGIGKYLKFSVMIDLIFKPVIFVAGFSMILILVVSMQNIMQGTIPKSFNGVTIGIESGSSMLNVSDISVIEVKENGLLGGANIGQQVTEVGQTIFVNLILFFLTAFLMWQFIKLSAVSGEGPIADIMGGERGIIKMLEKMAMTLPVLPLTIGTGTGATAASFGQVFGFSKGDTGSILAKQREKMLRGAGLNKKGEFGEYKGEGKFETNQEKFRDRISGGTNWKGSDYDAIAKESRVGGDIFRTTIELAKERKGGFVISSNTGWLKSLQQWIQNNPTTATGPDYKFSPRDSDTTTPDEYFKNEKNRKALYNALGGNDASGKTYNNGSPPSRDELQKMVFYGTPKTGSTLK